MEQPYTDELEKYKTVLYNYNAFLNTINKIIKPLTRNGKPLKEENAFFLLEHIERDCNNYCLQLEKNPQAYSLPQIKNLLIMIQQCAPNQYKRLKKIPKSRNDETFLKTSLNVIVQLNLNQAQNSNQPTLATPLPLPINHIPYNNAPRERMLQHSGDNPNQFKHLINSLQNPAHTTPPFNAAQQTPHHVTNFNEQPFKTPYLPHQHSVPININPTTDKSTRDEMLQHTPRFTPQTNLQQYKSSDQPTFRVLPQPASPYEQEEVLDDSIAEFDPQEDWNLLHNAAKERHRSEEY